MNRLVRKTRRTHNAYVRQMIRERGGQNPTFGITVTVIVLLLTTWAVLMWAVNQ